jgi:hypothetical protein
MYNNLDQKGLGGFDNNRYWSSSQVGADDLVWGWDFGFVEQGAFSEMKNTFISVRAIRAF